MTVQFRDRPVSWPSTLPVLTEIWLEYRKEPFSRWQLFHYFVDFSKLDNFRIA